MVVWLRPCESRTLSGINHQILDPKGRGFFLRGDKLNLPEVTVNGERNEGTKQI